MPPRRRPDFLGPRIHPTVRFFWGLGLLSCLVFAGDWAPRSLLALLGLALALASGKRVSIAYFVFLVGTVVVFHLFLPLGKVWVQLGPWAITDGAFYLGLGKGVTFAGLVFFSLASISRDLRLPGKFGAVWGKTFAWYEQLMDQRQALKPRALLLSIDRLLERLYPTKSGAPAMASEVQARQVLRTTKAGWALVAASSAAALTIAVLIP